MSGRPGLAISLYVSGRRCVVVGLADDRIATLRALGADVLAVSADRYEAALLDGAFLAVCAAPALAEAVSRDARVRHCLCYTQDLPHLSDFAMPAIARRGPLVVATTTEGRAPALAKHLRDEFQALLDSSAELDALLDEMEQVRAQTIGETRRECLSELAARLRIAGQIQIRPKHHPK